LTQQKIPLHSSSFNPTAPEGEQGTSAGEAFLVWVSNTTPRGNLEKKKAGRERTASCRKGAEERRKAGGGRLTKGSHDVKEKRVRNVTQLRGGGENPKQKGDKRRGVGVGGTPGHSKSQGKHLGKGSKFKRGIKWAREK